MRISQRGIALIQEFEGVKLTAYLCPANVWTIGWGHTRTARRGMTITRAEADRLLQEDLRKFETGVMNRVTRPMNQNQFDAFVSFAYNVGLGAFGSSTMLRLFNAGDVRGASAQFPRWNQGGGRVLAGLTRRRAAERKLFDTGVASGGTTTPSTARTHTVRAGETLGGIAIQHRTTVNELVRINSIANPNVIRVGQVLQLPASAVQFFPKPANRNLGLVDSLNAIGVDSSMANRRRIAAANGIQNYSGTAAQNNQMLTQLRLGSLRKA